MGQERQEGMDMEQDLSFAFHEAGRKDPLMRMVPFPDGAAAFFLAGPTKNALIDRRNSLTIGNFITGLSGSRLDSLAGIGAVELQEKIEVFCLRKKPVEIIESFGVMTIRKYDETSYFVDMAVKGPGVAGVLFGRPANGSRTTGTRISAGTDATATERFRLKKGEIWLFGTTGQVMDDRVNTAIRKQPNPATERNISFALEQYAIWDPVHVLLAASYPDASRQADSTGNRPYGDGHFFHPQIRQHLLHGSFPFYISQDTAPDAFAASTVSLDSQDAETLRRIFPQAGTESFLLPLYLIRKITDSGIVLPESSRTSALRELYFLGTLVTPVRTLAGWEENAGRYEEALLRIVDNAIRFDQITQACRGHLLFGKQTADILDMLDDTARGYDRVPAVTRVENHLRQLLQIPAPVSQEMDIHLMDRLALPSFYSHPFDRYKLNRISDRWLLLKSVSEYLGLE